MARATDSEVRITAHDGTCVHCDGAGDGDPFGCCAEGFPGRMECNQCHSPAEEGGLLVTHPLYERRYAGPRYYCASCGIGWALDGVAQVVALLERERETETELETALRLSVAKVEAEKRARADRRQGALKAVRS